MRVRLSIVLGLTLAMAVIAGAQAPTLADRAAAIDRVVTQPEGYRVVVGHISRELGIVVDTLRAQHAQTGLSWGEILVAHRVSREAKVSFDQIAAEYRTGRSWEDLARDHKVDQQKITAAIQRSQSVVEQRAEDKAPPPIGGTPSVAPPGVPASRY
jgi:hypothetical protein